MFLGSPFDFLKLNKLSATINGKQVLGYFIYTAICLPVFLLTSKAVDLILNMKIES